MLTVDPLPAALFAPKPFRQRMRGDTVENQAVEEDKQGKNC